MLSNEKPPQVPSETSQLKTSSRNFITSDEKSSDDSNKVDLFESGLGDINQTIPKFSIRNYVFSTRAKVIETHWPFSSKNLKLCLKHGLKDVLPPFETLESMKNQSLAIKYGDLTSKPSVKFSVWNDHIHNRPSEKSSQKLASEANQAIESKSPENDSTNVSCSVVNSYNIQSKSPLPEPEFQDLLFKKPETAVRAVEARCSPIARKPVKKGSSIVKSRNNNVAEQNLNEDFLETTMGSKVCPVCKMFMSSSNTTLNVHIDQCLSGESSTKWMANSRAVKNRVKPRKTRLMVDIYQKALSCTLEDLDRRNGTHWASNSDFPAQYSENYFDNDINNDISGEDMNKEGNVYFNSNGMKLRILSKFSDVKSKYSNEEDDCGTRRLIERNKASKIVPKKQKHLAQRHKFLKCPLFGQRRCSPRLERCPEVPTMKSNDSRIIRHCASSIRTGLEKGKNHHLNKITKESRLSSRRPPSIADKLMKSSNDLRFSISSDNNSVSDTDQSRKRKESMPLKSVDEFMPCQINRAGFFSFGPREFHSDGDDDEQNSKRLEESGPSPFSGMKKDIATFRRNKKMRTISSTFERQKLSPLNKNQSFINRTPVSESQKILRKKKFCFDKPRLDVSESHEETLSRSKIVMPQAERDSQNLSINRSRVLKIRKEKWGFLNSSEEPNSRVVEQDINSSLTDTTPASSPDAIETVEMQDEFVLEPTIEIQHIIDFPKSLEHEDCEQEICSNKVNQEPVDIIDVNEDEGNYSFEVDPIPIPGPPGSFLPSPARMASDEVLGNSSLTTFRVHSPEHNRPRSDSPSSYKSFESNSIPVVERPGQFERDPEVDQPNIGWPRANLEIPEVKFPIPSAANPVLRLMGKNLMVGNRDENLPPLTGSRQSSADIQNLCPPFNHNLCLSPLFLDYSHSHSSFTTIDSSPNPSRAMNSSGKSNEGSRSSFELLDQRLSTVGLDHPPFRPGFEKDPIFVPRSKEIIIMNVLPEQEPRSTFEMTCHENMEYGALGFESRHANSGFGCQTWCYPSRSWKMVESANITQNNGNSGSSNLCMPGALMNRDSLTELSSSIVGHYRASSMNLLHGFSLPANFA